MEERKEIVLKSDQTMRVPTKLRRHNTSMPIGDTLSSLTSTCPLTTHQHLGTMRTSHMGKEHRVKDLDRICNNIMPPQGSNNNNSSRK